MTTEYSINIDWFEEFKNNPDIWENHGKNILSNILENSDHPKFKEVADNLDVLKEDGSLKKYWDESLNNQDPMMNYGYPLHHEPTEEEILEIVLNTSCSVMENTNTGDFFLVLNGGGMDLSQSIAHAYLICGYIPDALAFNVSTQYGLNISGETYFKVMRKVRESLSNTMDSYQSKILRIDKAINEAKQRQKAKN